MTFEPGLTAAPLTAPSVSTQDVRPQLPPPPRCSRCEEVLDLGDPRHFPAFRDNRSPQLYRGGTAGSLASGQ